MTVRGYVVRGSSVRAVALLLLLSVLSATVEAQLPYHRFHPRPPRRPGAIRHQRRR